MLAWLPRGIAVPRMWCATVAGASVGVCELRVAVGALPLWWSPVPLSLGWFAALLVACDVRTRRLPDGLYASLAACLVLALLVAWWCGPMPGALVRAGLGVVLLGGSYALVRVVAPGLLGGGDVKLAANLGAPLGALSLPAVPVVVLAAALLTGAAALFARCWHGRRPDGVPHGPALLGPAWLVTACASFEPAGG